jgi:hypothetical protein
LVSGHALLQSSARWAQGTDPTFALTGFESGHCWLGAGSVATGTGTDGVGGGFGFDGLDDGLGDGLAAAPRSGVAAEPTAAAAGACAAAMRTSAAAQAAIRLITGRLRE